MRWNSQYALRDRCNEQRIVRKFLWWPRKFRFSPKCRWLEWANILEQVCECDIGGSMEFGNYTYSWREIGFAESVVDLEKHKNDKINDFMEEFKNLFSKYNAKIISKNVGDINCSQEEIIISFDDKDTKEIEICRYTNGTCELQKKSDD